MLNMQSYNEVLSLPSFKQRFDYLKLNGVVAHSTFGHMRYLNQALYQSEKWRRTRREVILRDDGCDLAIPDRPIYGKILVHHINPITPDDVLNRSSKIFDLDNLITVSFETHNALHYGDYSLVAKDVTIRRPNDTSPWIGG